MLSSSIPLQDPRVALQAIPGESLSSLSPSYPDPRSLSGAYDVMPEVSILLSFLAGDAGKDIVDILFDEAGHRVAVRTYISP
jgi:hypothetical protein